MTIEELQAQLAEATKRIDTLAAKNDELLTEVKTERTKRREAEEAQAQAAEEARTKAEEAAAKSGDLDSLRASLEARHAAAVAKAEQRAAEAEASLNRYVIDGGIRDALSAAEIAPSFAKAAGLLFRDGRNIEVKDGAAFVDGIPVADAVKEWAGADGAMFKAAGQATGGGAPGGGNSASKTRAEMGDAERLELARQGKLGRASP